MNVSVPCFYLENLSALLPDPNAVTGDDPLRRFSAGSQQEALTATANPGCAAWWLRSAAFAVMYGRFTAAEESAVRAIRLSLPNGEVEAVAEGWAIQARVQIHRGYFGIAHCLMEQIGIFVENAAGTRLEALYRELEGLLLLHTGNLPTGEYDAAETSFRRAIALYRACGDAPGESRAWEGWARTWAALGNYRCALETVMAAIKRCRETDEWRYCGALLACAASALSDAGQREGVSELFDQARDWSDFVGNRLSRLQSLAGQGRHYSYEMEEGANTEVLWRTAPIRCALDEAEEIQARPIAAFCHISLARIYEKAGDRAAQEFHRQIGGPGLAGARIK